MFYISRNWIAIPEALYFSLLLLFGILAVISIVALGIGTAKKKTARYFIVWSVILLVSLLYPIAVLRFHWIIANTMFGG